MQDFYGTETPSQTETEPQFEHHNWTYKTKTIWFTKTYNKDL